MRNNQVRKSVPKEFGKAASVILILSTLAAFTGCMGFSQSGSGSGQESGNLVLASATLDFGDVTTNNTKSLTVTASNSGNKTVSVSGASFSTKYFAMSAPSLPLSLAAGQRITFSISFTPNAAANFSATLSVASNASDGTQTLALSGTGTSTTQLQINPTTEPFGNVTVASSKSQVVTLNNATSSSISITKVTVGGTGYSLSGITTPLTLTASKTTTFTITFSPKVSGYTSGSAIISSDAANSSITIPLSGTGVTPAVGQLSVSPGTLALGNVTVGSSGTANGSVTASGASVTVTGASTNNSVFAIGGFSLPHTIAAGQSASFTITFSPTVAGSAGAILTFTSNGQPTTTTEALTGTGVAAATHSVALSWSPSTSANISGYNVYRASYSSSCGSFSKINSLLDTGTLYTDSLVKNGSSYCYATTAVDTGAVESGYSNIVSNVQVPTQ
jgi:hypothetical protein